MSFFYELLGTPDKGQGQGVLAHLEVEPARPLGAHEVVNLYEGMGSLRAVGSRASVIVLLHGEDAEGRNPARLAHGAPGEDLHFLDLHVRGMARDSGGLHVVVYPLYLHLRGYGKCLPVPRALPLALVGEAQPVGLEDMARLVQLREYRMAVGGVAADAAGECGHRLGVYGEKGG